VGGYRLAECQSNDQPVQIQKRCVTLMLRSVRGERRAPFGDGLPELVVIGLGNRAAGGLRTGHEND